MLSVLSCCCNSKVKPPVAPKPGIAGGRITTIVASLILANCFCKDAMMASNCLLLSFLSLQGFNCVKMVPLLLFVANVITFNPPKAAKCATPGVELTIFIILSKTVRLRAVDAASGNSYVIYKRPSSSCGIKAVGLDLKRKNVPTKMHINNIITYRAYLIIWFTHLE